MAAPGTARKPSAPPAPIPCSPYSSHSSECLLSVAEDTRSPRKTRGVRYPLRGITYKAQTIAKLGVRPPNYCHVPSSCLEVSFEPGADRRPLVHSDWKMDSVSVLWVCGR